MFELRIQRTYSEWLMIADDCESNATNIQSAFLPYRMSERASERTIKRAEPLERERKRGRNIDTVSTNTSAKLNHRASANDCVNTHSTNDNAFNNLCEKLSRWLFHSLSLPPETFRCSTSNSLGMPARRMRHTFSLMFFFASLPSCMSFDLLPYAMYFWVCNQYCVFLCAISPLLLLLSFVPEPRLCVRFSHSGFRMWHSACPTSQCWFIDVRCLTNFNFKWFTQINGRRFMCVYIKLFLTIDNNSEQG